MCSCILEWMRTGWDWDLLNDTEEICSSSALTHPDSYLNLILPWSPIRLCSLIFSRMSLITAGFAVMATVAAMAFI